MIEEFIEQSNRATSKEEVYDLFVKALNKLAYERTIYTYITDQPDINKLAEDGVVANYPDNWMDRYFECGYINEDPTFKRSLTSDGQFRCASFKNVRKFTQIEQKTMTVLKALKRDLIKPTTEQTPYQG